MSKVVIFGVIAGIICLISWMLDRYLHVRIGSEVAPFEIAGAALGLLLILRTNSGYDRWWEARKLWGGIVNQCRNLAISGLTYGPPGPAWGEEFVKWVAVFPHVARCSLRGEPPSPEVAVLVGKANADQIATSDHMPSFVAFKLGVLLRQAYDDAQMDGFAFMQVDKERATLIDHLGACERILRTPLPIVYAIKIRRFIMLFIMTLPFALLHRIENHWVIPFITMLVAYPLVALDQIGVELQNPFLTSNLSHLPLGEISRTIERNVTGLLQERRKPAIDATVAAREANERAEGAA
jgi:putative membrane protein